MVIAKDWRFQTSSDGSARTFAISSTNTPTFQVVSAASRKAHGAASFDVSLPLSGEPGVESVLEPPVTRLSSRSRITSLLAMPVLLAGVAPFWDAEL